jgi:hypothetical protein
LIDEYCQELERQVQQAKEEKILILETESDLLLNKIKDFKNKTKNEYLNNTQLKEKLYTERLNRFHDNNNKVKSLDIVY